MKAKLSSAAGDASTEAPAAIKVLRFIDLKLSVADP
jgi:hypothetical protein